MNSPVEKSASMTLRSPAAAAMIQRRLGLDRTQSQALVNDAILSIVDQYRALCRDTTSKNRLFDMICLMDDSLHERLLHHIAIDSAQNDAWQHFVQIVGTDSAHHQIQALTTDKNFTDAQAKDALGFAVPAVNSSIKTELAKPSVQNSSNGLEQCLQQAPVHAASVVTNDVHLSSDAYTHSEGNSLFRSLAPIFLCGALLLVTVKYFTDADKNAKSIASLQSEYTQAQSQIETLERDLSSSNVAMLDLITRHRQLEQDLNTAQVDAESSAATLTVLQTEHTSLQNKYERSQLSIGTLTDDLQNTNTELARLRDVPTDTAQLQQQLIAAKMERDDAVETNIANAALLAQSRNKESSLRFDLNTAVKVNASNALLIGDMRAAVSSLSTERDDLNQNLNAMTASLQKQESLAQDLDNRLRVSIDTNEALNAQVTTLTDTKTDLQTQLEKTALSLKDEQTARQHETESFTIQVGDLQLELATLNELQESAKNSLEERDRNLLQKEDKVADLTQQISELEKLNIESDQLTARLQQEATRLTNDFNVSQNSVIANVQALNETKQELTQSQAALQAALEQNKLLDKALQQTFALRDNVAAQRDTLTETIYRQKKELSLTEEKNTALTDKLIRISTDHDTAMVKIATLEKTINANDIELGEASAENQELQASIQRAEETVSALKTKKAEVENRVQTLETQTINLTRDLQAAEADTAGVSKLLDEANANSENRAAAYLDKQEKAVVLISKLEKAVSESNSQNSQLEQDNKELKEQLGSLTAVSKRITENTNTVLESVKSTLSKSGLKDVQVSSIEDNSAVSITLGASTLFRVGDASLTREGGQVLKKVSNALIKRDDWRIDVEGHTDSLPIGAKLRQRYPSNWELSSARASAVINYLRLATEVDAGSMSARGFAETQPVASNKTEAGRRQNRRVEIVLRQN